MPGGTIFWDVDTQADFDPARGAALLDSRRQRGVRVLSTDQVLLEVGSR